MSPQLQDTLHTLVQHPAIQLSFLMNEQGTLLGWSGQSEAFSPAGQFARKQEGEPEENLYMVLLPPETYLGVLFVEGAEVDELRAWIKDHEPTLQGLLAPEPQG